MIGGEKDESLGVHKHDKTGPIAPVALVEQKPVGNTGFSSQSYKRNDLKEISSFKGSIF